MSYPRRNQAIPRDYSGQKQYSGQGPAPGAPGGGPGGQYGYATQSGVPLTGMYGNRGAPGPEQYGSAPYASRGGDRYNKPPSSSVPPPHQYQQQHQQQQQQYQQQQQQAQYNSSAGGGADPTVNRKQEYDKLIHDCYSKFLIDANGRKVLETSYQTHINIKEYSQFPSQPPPDELDDSQVGSVKDRILVVCAKSSGRVLLQKGKFNEVKGSYQIGRTWDMDELKRISRVGKLGLILTLNKDYYWNVDEGVERIWKFTRVLAISYGNFVGKYPDIRGWSIQDLKLPPQPPGAAKLNAAGRGGDSPQTNDIVLNEPIAHPQLLKSKSLKRKNMPNPVLPPEPVNLQLQQQAQKQYKDIDFTANGKLPMKPMMPMQVDRAGSSTNVDQYQETKRHSHPYTAISGSPNPNYAADTSQESLSFVFTSGGSPVVDNRPRKQSVPQVESNESLDHHMDYVQRDSFEKPIHRFSLTKTKAVDSPDFGIEEVDDDEYSDDQEQEKPLFVRSNTGDSRKENGLGINQKKISSSPEVLEESSNIDELDTVSESIQEIESFMESQMDAKKSIRGGSRLILSSNLDIPHNNNLNPVDNESVFTLDYTNDSNLGLNIIKNDSADVSVSLEKDPEIEEILEEVNWNISDDSDALIKKLTKELNRVKFNNVNEVISLDFSNNAVSSDLITSLKEIENLLHIFKKTEVQFQYLSPEVNAIENNSQGLQVKSVNKKLLYNDLKEILTNVNMDGADLQAIESFTAFDRLNKVESIEMKLSNLFSALGAMRSNNNDSSNSEGLSSMKALKQYRATYEQVTESFTYHFGSFIRGEFSNLIKMLGRDLERISTHTLTRELNNVLFYSGFMFFIKDVSKDDYLELNGFFNQHMSDLLERILTQKLIHLKQSNPISATGSISDLQSAANVGMKNSRSSRSLRLSTKTKFRLRGSETPESSTVNVNSPASPSASTSFAERTNESQDSKSIIELITYSKELISIIQYFVGSMFHYDTNIINFNDFLKAHSYAERRKLLDSPSFDLTKSYSNEIIANLNAIFGGYINLLMKRLVPQDSHIPLILSYLEALLEENKTTNQEFLVFNFLKRSLEKFKSTWTKLIKNKVDSLNHSIIVAKCGILPAIKSFNQLILITESSLDNSNVGNSNSTIIRSMLDQSYQDLTEASIHLFLRDDPLLKNSEFDEKEKQHRNVSILQNIFYLTEQLSVFNNTSEGLRKLKSSFESVFKKVEDAYFKRLLHKNVGKLVEFVDNYEALSKMGGQKKYNKKVVKSLLSSYTHKDISMKVHEIFKKLEKHFITGGDMFEKDLLDRLWKDMEAQVTDYFERLGKIVRSNFDREIEYNINKNEIHSIFSQIH